jgi:hypothetical protein
VVWLMVLTLLAHLIDEELVLRASNQSVTEMDVFGVYLHRYLRFLEIIHFHQIGRRHFGNTCLPRCSPVGGTGEQGIDY